MPWKIMEDFHRIQTSNMANHALLPRPKQPLQILKSEFVSRQCLLGILKSADALMDKMQLPTMAQSNLAAFCVAQTHCSYYLHSLVRGGEGPRQRQHPLDLLLQQLLPPLHPIERPTPADDGRLQTRLLEVHPLPQLVQFLRLAQCLPPHLPERQTT